MKALLNPNTDMVLTWTPLKANMSHLQEVQVSGPEAINQLYSVVATVAKKKKPAKKKAGKKKDPEKLESPVGQDDFDVDNL